MRVAVIRIELNSPTTKSCEICLTRRSVQSQAKNLVFPINECLSPSVVNLTFLYYLRVIDKPNVYAMKKAAMPSILFVVVVLAVAIIAEAQQPTKIPRIGY